ncbi:Putative membrane spanning protein [Staphylococcus aureus]|nr:Putative membrane spanning protein [Staphylococcus aureus]
MTINIIVLIVSIIGFQLIIGHIWHDIGLSYLRSILLMMLPFGLGVFIQQVSYYERQYPKWQVPQNIKVRLKYIYLTTFFRVCRTIPHFIYGHTKITSN